VLPCVTIFAIQACPTGNNSDRWMLGQVLLAERFLMEILCRSQNLGSLPCRYSDVFPNFPACCLAFTVSGLPDHQLLLARPPITKALFSHSLIAKFPKWPTLCPSLLPVLPFLITLSCRGRQGSTTALHDKLALWVDTAFPSWPIVLHQAETGGVKRVSLTMLQLRMT
jgi:hypothetical protein